MLRKILLTLTSGITILITGCATNHDWDKAMLADTKKNTYLIESYDANARKVILDRAKHKDATTIELFSGPTVGSFKPLFTPELYGYVVCYNVNTKNIFGGITGNRLHLFVFKNNSILVEASQSGLDPINDKKIAETCQTAITV